MTEMPNPLPKHTYEMVEGTEPTTYAQHQPRTVKHVTTTGDKTDLSMMTEIGDGVFVNWTECRKCNKHVSHCTCTNGPTEPEYMKKWRDDRFARDLNTRPDPAFPMLDSVISWVRERGFTVIKKGTKVSKEDDYLQSEAGSATVTEEQAAHLKDLATDDLPVASVDEELKPGDCECCGPDPDLTRACPATRHGSHVLVDPDVDDERDHAETEPGAEAATYDRETGEKIESTALHVDAGLDSALERVRAARDLSNIDADF